MIADLDKTLRVLLVNGLASDLAAGNISFLVPDDTFPPTGVLKPTVNLFLYDVRENLELRRTDWILERNSNGTTTKQPPPVRVDCSYLITAWISTAGTTSEFDEHSLLSDVMRVLLSYRTIPQGILQGSLSGQEPPLPAAVLQPGRLQSLGEFWQALGGKPKAALNYTVTIGMQPQEPLEGGPSIIDTKIKFSNK